MSFSIFGLNQYHIPKEWRMEKGDHLVSSRIGYTHHGLYIGCGKVIHYSGFSSAFDKGSIEITTLNKFEQGNGSRVKYHVFPLYNADKRVERAYSKLGEDSYNLIFNNCEHFVSWCFDGVKNSSQVDNVTMAANALGNEYFRRKTLETTAIEIAQKTTRTTTTKAVEAAITSAVAKTAVSTTASTAAGVTAASALTGSTAGVVSAVAAGSFASAVAPVAIAVGVGYGVKKVIDWIWD